jgi:hypothetical protein
MAKGKRESGDDELGRAIRRFRANMTPAGYAATVLEDALAAEERIRSFLHGRGESALSHENVADVVSNVEIALLAPSLVWFLERLRLDSFVDGPRVIASVRRGGAVTLANVGTKATTLGKVMGAKGANAIAGDRLLPPIAPSARIALDSVLRVLRLRWSAVDVREASKRAAENRDSAMWLIDFAARTYYTSERFGHEKLALGELARDLGLESGSAAFVRRLQRWRRKTAARKGTTKRR